MFAFFLASSLTCLSEHGIPVAQRPVVIHRTFEIEYAILNNVVLLLVGVASNEKTTEKG